MCRVVSYRIKEQAQLTFNSRPRTLKGFERWVGINAITGHGYRTWRKVKVKQKWWNRRHYKPWYGLLATPEELKSMRGTS